MPASPHATMNRIGERLSTATRIFTGPFLLWLLLFQCLGGSVAFSSDITSCNAALAASQIRLTSSQNLLTQLVTLQIIDDQTFSQLKHDFGTNGTFLIYDIPITASMTYGDFQQAAERKYGEYHLDLTTQQATAWSAIFLSDQASQIYKDCIVGLRPSGLHLWPVHASPNSLSVQIKFSINTDPGKQYRVIPDYTGGALSKGSASLLGNPVPSKQEITLLFNRSSIDQEFVILLNTLNIPDEQASDSFYIPPRARITDHTQIGQAGPHDDLDAGGAGDGKNWGPEVEHCINPDKGWQFDVSKSTVSRVERGRTPNSQYGIKTEKSGPNVICYFGRASDANGNSSAVHVYLLTWETQDVWIDVRRKWQTNSAALNLGDRKRWSAKSNNS